MAEMVDVVHPESGGTGRIPVRALKSQKKLGWMTAEEYAAKLTRKATPPPAPAPAPTPPAA